MCRLENQLLRPLHAILLQTLFCIIFISALAVHKSLEPIGQRRCTKPVLIRIPECQNTFYNYTGMPNLVEQDTQYDAHHQLQTFQPLITHKCSSKLNFFLCSVYTPMCDVNTHHLIGPCRPLCEHVRTRCTPVLRIFKVEWPANLNCSRFPLKNVEGGPMCMEGPQDSEETNIPPPDSTEFIREAQPTLNELGENALLHDLRNNKGFYERSLSSLPSNVDEVNKKLLTNWIIKFSKLQSAATSEVGLDRGEPSSILLFTQSFRHCIHLKKATFYIYLNLTRRCVPRCEANILFDTNAKKLAVIWTGVLTALCCLFTVPTLIIYVLDTKMFCALERPIVYIALCQLFFSLGYVLSIGLGRNAVTCGRDLDSGKDIRLQEGLENSVCALVFMIHYFFTIASTLWWTILSVQWAQYHVGYLSNRCLAGDGQYYTRSNNITEHCFSHDDQIPQICSHDIKMDSNTDTGLRSTHTVLSGIQTRDTKNYQQPDIGISVFQNGISLSRNRFFNSKKTISGHSSVRLAREHAFVWLTAGLLTIIVLVTKNVDADELLPVCGVGRQNTRAMSIYLLGPQLTLGIPGFLGLIVGVLALVYRKRLHKRGIELCPTFIRQSGEFSRTTGHNNLVNSYSSKNHAPQLKLVGNKPLQSYRNARTANSECLNGCTSNSEPNPLYVKKFSVYAETDFGELRLGLFCFLFFLPELCMNACNIYECLFRDSWLQTDAGKTNMSKNDQSSLLPFRPKVWHQEDVVGPNPEVFLLRIFMSLVPGFTCSLWITAVKGIGQWKRILENIYYYRRLRKEQGPNSTSKQSNKIKDLNWTTNEHLTFHSTNMMKSKGPSGCSVKNEIVTTSFLPNTPLYAFYHYYAPGVSSDTLQPRCIWSVKPTIDGQIDPIISTGVDILETQHSNATTPGYYSQAKLGSGIEASDTFSEDSPIPPPLPVSSRPKLPARGDPCIGASMSQMPGFSNQQKSSYPGGTRGSNG